MAESSSYAVTAFGEGSDEDRVESLDRMLTRLALCDDFKLEDLLSKLLPMSIASLSSQSVAVRNKVIELLSHVNKRVQHQLEIGLPWLELWKMYVGDNTALMVKSFCIVYIKMAFERTGVEENEFMGSMLLASLSKISPHHQELILGIVIEVIGKCHSSGIDDKAAEKYRSICGYPECDTFLEFCLHTILYTPLSQGEDCPAGLSIAQSKHVTGKHPVTSEILLRRKLGILNVIEAMKMAPELVYSLYLAACVDFQEPVAKRGEELLKKVSDVNLDDSALISRLFLLFNGTIEAGNIDPESKINPASSALRIKLVSTFCRSIKAANNFPSTLQCIFGCIYGSGTTLRLKQLGMEFTVWVFKHARDEQLKLMGPVILTGILKSLDTYPNSGTDAPSRATKIFGFQVIGLLAERMPQLFRDKIDMAVRLFNALKLVPQFFRPVVQEATNSLVNAYKGASAAVLKDLETLLLENSQVEQSEVRFCAVRWATSLFDLSHCPSRFICLLRVEDSKLDIREMAVEGLNLNKYQEEYTSRTLNPEYPKLGTMLDYIMQQRPGLRSTFTEKRDQKILFPSDVFVAMIKFLMKCFEADVAQNISVQGTSEFCSSVEQLCLLFEHAMVYDGSVELHAVASKSLITVGAHYPLLVASRYAVKISWLKQLLSHIDLDTRECAARLLGIASAPLPISLSSALIEELILSIRGFNKSRFETLHGTLCALGYVVAECISKLPAISESLLHSSLQCLVNVVTSETPIFASTAMQAIGHIGLRGSLPLLFQEDCLGSILEILLGKLKKILSGDDIKAIQKIVISLGHICFMERSSSHLLIALDLIFSLCRSKVEDVLFAAGEALSFMWGGIPVTADVILKTDYSSLYTTSNFLTGDISSTLLKYNTKENTLVNEDGRAVVRTSIITKLFDVLLYSSRKEERCSGTVWLLSLTMYCGHHPSIQEMLPEIQDAFSHLLGEQNELTQELASQGMSIVYEIGDVSMKNNLVNALVSTLTGSGKRKRSVKLVGDSEVFQDGVIGESPSGGKLNTYKELCSLANDMGQPDLIYKFMDLANYQASLNSKRGAAFGFSKIAKQAGNAIQPHLRLLIPKLVRYQYDPDKNVQDAMSHIWKSLVFDPSRTIDEHLDLILDDLLVQCGSRLWRSREASCLAIADILLGRNFAQVGKHLKTIWIVTFRAMDDIKESVRNSAVKLNGVLSFLTIRLCDFLRTDERDACQAMDIVLPFFLEEGIMSKVESIRKSSIAMVTKLAKDAGVAIRPHLPDLVCCMLESLSSLEDQGLNYVELNADNIGIQMDKLENLRITIAKGSPMWETLDLCAGFVQSQSLDLLVPRLSHLVRSGVGLNTRIGVASFISLLVQKVTNDIRPFTSMLLMILFPAVREEKSVASKRAFGNACALVLKFAAVSQVQQLIDDTVDLHTGDRNCQVSCAILLKCYSSNAADVLSGYHAVIFPVIFVARFEDDQYISSLFEELWDDNTSGERITLQLYLGEIVSLVCDSIAASSWASKRKSAKAISKLSEVLGESLSSYNQILITSLMKELHGRLWEGKDCILYAMGALCMSCHKAISNHDPSSPSLILHAVSSACKKKDKKFCEAALSCLEQVIKAFADPGFFNSVFPLLFEMCESPSLVKPGQDFSSADSGTSDAKENMEAPREKVLDCIKACVSVACISAVIEHAKDLMDVLLVSLSPGFPWTVKMSAFSLIKLISSRLHGTAETTQISGFSSFVHELFFVLSPKMVECMETMKIAQVHIAASECLLELCSWYEWHPSAQEKHPLGLKDKVMNQCEVEKNEQAKSLLKKCVAIIQDSSNKLPVQSHTNPIDTVKPSLPR